MGDGSPGARMRNPILPHSFFMRPADVVARALLGQRLRSCRGGVVVEGRIIETEAYLGLHDPASHAYRGRRYAGNTSLYGPPGTWYVYRSYGLHWCANLVCAPDGAGAAVLLRALAPDGGLRHLRTRRPGVEARRWTDGPGKLCQALGIDRDLDGQAMATSEVVVLAGPAVTDAMVRTTPRVGITRAAELLLRFVADGEG